MILSDKYLENLGDKKSLCYFFATDGVYNLKYQ